MNLKKLIIGNHLYFGRDASDNFIQSTGTVSVTNGDATVTGAGGASFTTEPDPGDIIFFGGRRVVVLSVTDSTHLELTQNWFGPTASGLSFWQQTDNSISSTAKPATDNDWLSIGDIEDVNIAPKRAEDDVYSPSPGKYVLSDSLIKTTELTVDFTLQDMSEIFYELLMQSVGPISTSTGIYAPYSASGQLKGWTRCSQYGQNDALVNIFEQWGKITVDATKFDNSRAKGKVTLRCFANPLNSGILTLSLG